MLGAGNAARDRPAAAAANARALGTIDALQAIRAVAALLVVVDHALIAAAQGGLVAASIRPFAIQTGFLGVYVFFAVIGFVMVYSHGDDFARRGAPLRFLARRVSRILPLYWISILVMVLVRPETASSGTLILSLLLIPHQMIGGPFGWPLFVLGWTLQYEFFFYLLFAAALLLPRGRGLSLLAACLAAAVTAWSLGWLGGDNAVAYLAHPIVLYFLAGVAIGLLQQRLPERLSPGFGTALLIAGAALGASAAAAFAWSGDPLRVLLATAAAPVAAVAACALSRPDGPDTLARRAVRMVGDATYSIYMVHAFLVFPAGPFLVRHPVPVPWPIFLLLALAVSVAAGVATYRWVEKPLVKALGSLLRQRPGIGGRQL